MKIHHEPKNNSADQYLFFECLGLPEKDIAATAVVRALRNAHPDGKIVVVSLNPEVWLHNPNVFRVYRAGATPYFFEDYIEGRGTLFFRHDPYHSADFAYRRKHLTEIWCDLCKVAWDGEKPELYFTARENEAVGKILTIQTGGKPVFMIQTHGGPIHTPYQTIWGRDLPVPLAEKIVSEMNDRGYASIQLALDGEPGLANAPRLQLSFRQMLCALQFSQARLFVHSFAQAAAAALTLPSTVPWIGNRPKVFGYSLHSNIAAKAREGFRDYLESYMEHYDFGQFGHDSNLFAFEREWEQSFDAKTLLEGILQGSDHHKHKSVPTP